MPSSKEIHFECKKKNILIQLLKVMTYIKRMVKELSLQNWPGE